MLYLWTGMLFYVVIYDFAHVLQDTPTPGVGLPLNLSSGLAKAQLAMENRRLAKHTLAMGGRASHYNVRLK